MTIDSYVGNRPLSETAGTRREWAPAADTDTFSVQYVPGYLDVFVNGAKLVAADFTATNGTSFTLVTPTVADDTVAIIAWALIVTTEDAFPVGSIYLAAGIEDPNTFRPGTWSKIAAGRMLIGAGTLGSDTYVAGDEGGEARHTLTVDESPIHTHSWNYQLNGTAGSNRAAVAGQASSEGAIGDANDETGGDQPHENRPPYLAVNIWERIA